MSFGIKDTSAITYQEPLDKHISVGIYFWFKRSFLKLLKARIAFVLEGMYRLPKEIAKELLPQIPVHPISYKDAEPLLR